MDSNEIKRIEKRSQTFNMKRSLDALLSMPGKRHCILCWEHAITKSKPDDELGREEMLGDIAAQIKTGQFGSSFGADETRGCEYPYHDEVVKHGTTGLKYSVWAKPIT